MIENKLTNLSLFVAGKGYAGNVKEIKLPTVKAKLEDHAAGGMGAPIKMTTGQFDALEAEFTLTGFDDTVMRAFRVVEGETVPFTARGSTQSQDGTKKPVEVTMTGLIEELDYGTWAPGKEAELKVKMALRYYKLAFDGSDLMEIDPINMVAIIDGTDQLEEVRAHLGM